MREHRYARRAGPLAAIAAALAIIAAAAGQGVAAFVLTGAACLLIAAGRVAGGRSPVERHAFSPAQGAWDAGLVPFEWTEGLLHPLRQRDGACRHCGRDRGDPIHT